MWLGRYRCKALLSLSQVHAPGQSQWGTWPGSGAGAWRRDRVRAEMCSLKIFIRYWKYSTREKCSFFSLCLSFGPQPTQGAHQPSQRDFSSLVKSPYICPNPRVFVCHLRLSSWLNGTRLSCFKPERMCENISRHKEPHEMHAQRVIATTVETFCAHEN